MSKRNEGFGERKKRTKMAKKALTPHVNNWVVGKYQSYKFLMYLN
jgi:hypothetical protein